MTLRVVKRAFFEKRHSFILSRLLGQKTPIAQYLGTYDHGVQIALVLIMNDDINGNPPHFSQRFIPSFQEYVVMYNRYERGEAIISGMKRYNLRCAP